MSIEKYNFHDEQLDLDFENSDVNTVNMAVFYHDITSSTHESDVSFHLVKCDVIALAKHFKLTSDDLE